MPHIVELRFPPDCLAIKPAVRIAGAGMRGILALLPVEVGPAVIIARRRLARFADD
jgi:hypothetical protein